MDAAQFRSSPAGRLVRTVQGALGFVPHPLPPRLALESLVEPIADASRKLGELAGIGRGLQNPYLLIAPFQRREAVASSRIEGTVASLSDLLSIEAGARQDRRPPDTQEVRNYVRALDHALARLEKLPLSLRLIREIHAVLLGGSGGHGNAGSPAGEFRRVQNWIGGRSLESALFVPAPVNELGRALDALEKYVHSNSRLPIIVDAALIHYQFEAIHPFPDGNGRVGRLLIPLFLVARRALPTPLLYLSPFFERNRAEYYERLLEVSRSGDWLGWIGFFVRGTAEQALDTVARLRRLSDLRDRYRAAALTGRASVATVRLLDHVFAAPYVTMPSVRALLGVTHRAAQKQIDRLVERKILSPVRGESRPRLYIARGVLEVLLDDGVHAEVAGRRGRSRAA